jgi:small subunit ribosomal protein S20
LIVKGSAAKSLRKNEKRRQHNKTMRSRLRTSVRRMREAIKAGDKNLATERFALVTKLMDTATRKGLYHKNTAARTKSRLQKQLNALE